MPWLKVLHIATLSLWCGALLYMPALIMAQARSATTNEAAPLDIGQGLPRAVYTLFATPMALLAIISGSLLFVGVLNPDDPTRDFPAWLLVKLLLVAGMVVCHALNGWLIQRSEQMQLKGLGIFGYGAMTLSAVLIVGVLWLVLATPL